MDVGRRRIGWIVVLMGVLVSVASAPLVRAGEPLTFGISVNHPFMFGSGPVGTLHTLTLYAPGGAVADRATAFSDASGEWSVTWEVPVLVGSKVAAQAGAMSRMFTVPKLSVKANRATNVISGRASAGTMVTVKVDHHPVLGGGISGEYTDIATTDGTGKWSTDFSSLVNVIGRDDVRASFTTGSGDYVSVTGIVPYMVVTRSSSDVEGSLNHGTSTTLELRTASNSLKATAVAAWSRQLAGFQTSFANSAGDLVNVRAGYRVKSSFATDALITVPSISISANASTDMASGACMPNAPYRLDIRRFDGSNSELRFGTASGAGNVTEDFSVFNVQNPDRLVLTCRFATGDQVKTVGWVQ